MKKENKIAVVVGGLLLFALVVFFGFSQQQTQPQKEEFTEDNLQFLSVWHHVSTNFAGSDSEYFSYVCDLCTKGRAIHPISGDEMFTNKDPSTLEPGQSVSFMDYCDLSMNYRVNIKSPENWPENQLFTCEFYINGERQVNYGLEEGIFAPRYATGYENKRMDRDNIFEICCEGVCESKTLPSAC